MNCFVLWIQIKWQDGICFVAIAHPCQRLIWGVVESVPLIWLARWRMDVDDVMFGDVVDGRTMDRH